MTGKTYRLVSYVTNQWIEIRGGRLAGDGGGENTQLIHSVSGCVKNTVMDGIKGKIHHSELTRA